MIQVIVIGEGAVVQQIVGKQVIHSDRSNSKATEALPRTTENTRPSQTQQLASNQSKVGEDSTK